MKWSTCKTNRSAAVIGPLLQTMCGTNQDLFQESGRLVQADALCDHGYTISLYFWNEPSPEKYLKQGLSPLFSCMFAFFAVLIQRDIFLECTIYTNPSNLQRLFISTQGILLYMISSWRWGEVFLLPWNRKISKKIMKSHRLKWLSINQFWKAILLAQILLCIMYMTLNSWILFLLLLRELLGFRG